MEFMEFGVSDELLGTVVPILVYWVYSGIYVMLGSLENYRLHSKMDEDDKNLVSKSTVIKGVLLQQIVQAIVAILLFTVRPVLSCFNLLIIYFLTFSYFASFDYTFLISMNCYCTCLVIIKKITS
ncbi:hypothetical protein CsSME_00043654 [Camellia sinensis var. sinensis]